MVQKLECVDTKYHRTTDQLDKLREFTDMQILQCHRLFREQNKAAGVASNASVHDHVKIFVEYTQFEESSLDRKRRIPLRPNVKASSLVAAILTDVRDLVVKVKWYVERVDNSCADCDLSDSGSVLEIEFSFEYFHDGSLQGYLAQVFMVDENLKRLQF